MNVATESPKAARPGRGLLAIAIIALVLSLVAIVSIALFFLSDGVRDSTFDRLDAASPADVAAAETAAVAASARADEALRRAEQGPTAADVDKLRADVSNFELELASLRTALSDTRAQLAAQCDWARLQETNAAGTSLANVFDDFVQTVCPSG